MIPLTIYLYNKDHMILTICSYGMILSYNMCDFVFCKHNIYIYILYTYIYIVFNISVYLIFNNWLIHIIYVNYQGLPIFCLFHKMVLFLNTSSPRQNVQKEWKLEEGCFSSQKSLQFESSIWANYSDLTRPHPKWWFSKGNLLISGKSRLVKYYNLARSM